MIRSSRSAWESKHINKTDTHKTYPKDWGLHQHRVNSVCFCWVCRGWVGGHLSPILSIETIILPIFSVSFLFGPMLVFSLSFHKSCMRCDLGRFDLVSPVFCLMLFLAAPLKLEQRRKGCFHKFIRTVEKSSTKQVF